MARIGGYFRRVLREKTHVFDVYWFNS